MKTLIRDTLAYIPGLRFWIARSIFLGPNHNTHRFWGVFPTQAEAQAYVPANFNQGFDAPDLEDFSETIHERDQNSVRVLSGLFPQVKRIFDLGGNVGMCFYQYRKPLTYAPDLRWIVCDVPFVNGEGRRIAAKRGETQLFFTDRREEAEGVDLYMTNGALQYLDETFAEILGRLKNKPKHVLINRVPLTEHDSFFTLQHMGYSIVPYHLVNRAAFVAGIEALGYRLAEEWKNDRYCDIILRPDRRVEHYYGYHFVKISD